MIVKIGGASPAAPTLVAIFFLIASALFAADDPHGKTYGTQCLSCHAIHKSAGADLTNAISNESLCASCHNLAGTASRYPIESFAKADPNNALGDSHAWNVAAGNASAGAQAPQGTALAAHTATNITCSSCHDQHHGAPDGAPAGSVGAQTRTSATRIAGTGTGSVSYTATSNAASKGYLLDIIETAGAAGVAKFRLSNDGGLSWFGWNSASWVPYANNARLTGANVALNNDSDVLVTFSGNFAIGDRIRFHVTYPFLRAPLDSGDNLTGVKFCRDCHRDLAMDHAAASTWDGTMKSHPVGIVLGANGKGLDRAVPLDANGAPQGGAGADANDANDLLLAADATVQCLTCHAVHHADGNANTP